MIGKYNKYIFTLIIILTISFSFHNINSSDNIRHSYFTKNKFFVKTKIDLPISEATGEISTNTGNSSFDNLNSKFKIKKIKRVFEINNGDVQLYNKLEMSRIYTFYIDENVTDFDNLFKSYSDDNIVEYCEPNFIGFGAGEKGFSELPNDTYFSLQWYLRNNGNVRPSSGGMAKMNEDINMIKAWEIEQGSESVIIAILDSGIEDESPDLSGRLWINTKEIPNNRKDDDRNGYVDDYRGWDFAYESNNIRDGFGHGTNIASVIGAKSNNNFGFAGMNSVSKLMICKNLSDNNSGEYEWWAKSIKYAVDNGAKIINMSEGGDDYSKVLKAAVDYATNKDVFLAAAMMNKGDGNDYYPAAYPGVFAVGATDSDGKRCKKFSWGGGSCYGKHISVVAPGNKIYGVDYEDPYKFDTFWSGTSQSTAIVSGLASLLLSQDLNRSADDIKKIIKETAKDEIGALPEDKKGFDIYYGWGRIDCFDALTYNRDDLKKNIDNKYPDIINKDGKEKEKIYNNDDDTRAKSITPEKNESKNRKGTPAKRK